MVVSAQVCDVIQSTMALYAAAQSGLFMGIIILRDLNLAVIHKTTKQSD